MSTTQSIIIYRNPVEAAFWENGMVFPLFVSLCVFMLVMVGLVKIIERKIQRWTTEWANAYTVLAIIISAVAAGGVFHWMM